MSIGRRCMAGEGKSGVGEVHAKSSATTERRGTEKLLGVSGERYRAIVEASIDGIYQVDTSGKFIYMNESFAAILGYKPGDLLGKPVAFILSSEALPKVMAMVKAALSGENVRDEIPVKHKDGSEVVVGFNIAPLYVNSETIGLTGVISDITERKKAEEALRESEAHYSALVRSLTDAVFKIRDGAITWCNDRVEAVYGYTKDELVGRQVGSLFPEDINRWEFIRAVSAAIKEDGFFRDIGRIKKKDGSIAYVEYTISLIPESDPVELVALGHDITERKHAEEEKLRLEEQLGLAGRLATVGELAAGVAHELNNPLAAIQGFAQLLTAKDGLDDDTKKGVQTIYKEAQRAARITTNLLSFARRHETEKSYISINEALEKTLELRAHQLKLNNIELVREFQPSLPKTMADFQQMQQVFINIINNAEQAMLEAHGKGRLIVRTQAEDRMAKITFADDGPGISKENLNRIFDPFFTTKEVGKGTGLGLSICYGLVQAHSGRIYARSKLGQGATFVVEIPIVSNAS
jgi:two-component system NtrC family sensor kinase